MPPPEPQSLRVRAYQVGFGDCLLLSFAYAAGERRHVLIDFGSMQAPKHPIANMRVEIAKQIKAECGGDLMAVVATHRHRDHIDGFATKPGGGGSGDIIAALKPRLVIQPWTEHPDAEKNALEAPDRHPLVAMLAHMNAVAGHAQASAKTARLQADADPKVVKRLGFIGEDNVKNLSAVRNLMKMGEPPAKRKYVQYGDDCGLGALLPGVKVHVLGPPSLKDWKLMRSQRDREEEEFWHLQAATTPHDSGESDSPFPRHARRGDPVHARWLRRRIVDMRAESMLSIVTQLDSALNNTSVILLFEIGGKCLLFPGDAQIETWWYALKEKKAENADLIRRTVLYKVGHHGSLNATPHKSLWDLLERRGPAGKPDRLKTVLSTVENSMHGHAESDTEVPRQRLLDELKSKSELHSTHTLGAGELFVDTVVTFP